MIWRSASYRRFVADHPCCMCGDPGQVSHHIRTGGMGGTAVKPPDWMCAPLCNACHMAIHAGRMAAQVCAQDSMLLAALRCVGVWLEQKDYGDPQGKKRKIGERKPWRKAKRKLKMGERKTPR